MTTEQAEYVAEELKRIGVEVEVYSNYSGRGMFGKTAAGLVCSPGDAMLVGYACRMADVPVEDLPRRSETMGLDVIYY